MTEYKHFWPNYFFKQFFKIFYQEFKTDHKQYNIIIDSSDLIINTNFFHSLGKKQHSWQSVNFFFFDIADYW